MKDQGKRLIVSQRSLSRAKYLEQYAAGRLTRAEVAEALSLSERQVSRLCKRWEDQGIMGIEHRLSGRESNFKTPAELRARIEFLYVHKYIGFNYTHFHEMLERNESIRTSYSTVKRICSRLGPSKRPRRRLKVRRYRDRSPCVGMMLQMDGSDHQWVRGQNWVLIAGIDDATSEVPYGEFFPTESMEGYLSVLNETFKLKGVPLILYVDHASWLSGTTKHDDTGQFKRICDELGITLMFANSPQAKGRIERLWNTLQDRLIAEFSLHQIKDIKAATNYFNDEFLAKTWNPRFTLRARKPESYYRPAPTAAGIAETFCTKTSRKVRNDHTFYWNNKIYKITSKLRFSLAKQMIEIRVQKDGSFTANHSGRNLEFIPIERPWIYGQPKQGKSVKKRSPKPQPPKIPTRHFY